MSKTYVYCLTTSPIQVGILEGGELRLKKAPELNTAPGALVLGLLAKGRVDKKILERAFFSRSREINQNGVAKLAQRTRELMTQSFGDGKWVRQSQLDLFFEGGCHYCDVINGPYHDVGSYFGTNKIDKIRTAKRNLDTFSSGHAWIKEYKRWLCTTGNEAELIYGDTEECNAARGRTLASIEALRQQALPFGQIAFLDVDGTSNILNALDSSIALDRSLERLSKFIKLRLMRLLSPRYRSVIDVQRWGYDAFSIVLRSESTVYVGHFVSIVEGAIKDTIAEQTDCWVNVSFGLQTFSGGSAAQELSSAILGCRESKKRRRSYTITKPLFDTVIAWSESSIPNSRESGDQISPVQLPNTLSPRQNAQMFSDHDYVIKYEVSDPDDLSVVNGRMFGSESLNATKAVLGNRCSDSVGTRKFIFPAIPFETKRLSERDAEKFVKDTAS